MSTPHDPLDPTDPRQLTAGTRGHERDQRGHGATTDPEGLSAYRRATATRRAASARTAVVVTRSPRGYTAADHERAEALRSEAASVRRIAGYKTDEFCRRLVEREAAKLKADAEAIVPIRHARSGWR
jgi:hypothetical protein